ncbi:hypothetical protein PTE30175_00738 [Pandoraea terrae]|uniref:Uncharacterized protein n=1 Tax=Pandoraea terrae TaxID=1537710 RepID=A0A5E4SH48_9BURK|nr:hypothetical protein [Pandoraea terrae]VVD74373.1 hypothetical protein PTE30175_00738 [Pandoraea terrae]
MESSEFFLPVGSIELSKEQSAAIKAALGQDVNAVPIYRVVPMSSENHFLPLSGVPGLSGIVVHYGAGPSQEPAGAQVIASVIAEMANPPVEGEVFAAHTKLMAPRPDKERAADRPAQGKTK